MRKVSVSGATGWTGGAIAAAVDEAPDTALAPVVSRKIAGQARGRRHIGADHHR